VYKTPCLEKVIIRVDLASPSFYTQEALPGIVLDAVLPRFPIIEPREVKPIFEISASSSKASQATSETHWALFGRDREKDLLIAPSHFYIEQRRYESYEHLESDFVTVFDALVCAFPDMRASRFGLRYVNKIQPEDESDPLNWEGLINKSMLAIFDIPRKPESICRAFHTLARRIGDGMLTMQYGMHNPDFPATIRQKVFVIDIDASYQGALTPKEVKGLSGEYHTIIRDAFEDAIQDALREMMGVVT